ncbi:MAG: hypothetical protein WDN44_14015 [Sphingomonas sp.]
MRWTAIRAGLLAGAGAVAAMVAAGAPVPAAAQAGPRIAWVEPEPLDTYAWIDRADALSEAIGEAPPDFAFAFDGGQPWTWTAADGSVLIVEQAGDGPHGYYFDAGADTPYLVRESDRSFAYSRGLIAVVYGPDGRVLSHAEGDRYLDDAVQGYARGRELKRAMARREQWSDVSAGTWIDFGLFLGDWDRQWGIGRQRYPGWARHRRSAGAIFEHRRYAHDGRRWLTQQQQFQRWQENGYQGPAPGRWTPPVAGEWHPRGAHRGGGPGRPGRPRTGGRPDRPGPTQPPHPVIAAPVPAAPALPPVKPPTPRFERPSKPNLPAPDLPVESDAGAPVPGTMAPRQPRRPWDPDGANRPRPTPQAGADVVRRPTPAARPALPAERPVFHPAPIDRPSYRPPAPRPGPGAGAGHAPPPAPPAPRAAPPSPPRVSKVPSDNPITSD